MCGPACTSHKFAIIKQCVLKSTIKEKRLFLRKIREGLDFTPQAVISSQGITIGELCVSQVLRENNKHRR